MGNLKQMDHVDREEYSQTPTAETEFRNSISDVTNSTSQSRVEAMDAQTGTPDVNERTSSPASVMSSLFPTVASMLRRKDSLTSQTQIPIKAVKRNGSKATRAATPKQWTGEAGVSDVCQGQCTYICHPNPDAKNGFDCLCQDQTKVEPGEKCKETQVNIEPSPEHLFRNHHLNDSMKPHPTNILGVIVVVSLSMMFILALIYWRRKTLIALLRQRHREKKSDHQQSPVSLAKSQSLLTYNFASNPNYYAQAPDSLPLHTLEVHLIDKEQIAFIGELGEGCFGKVYKGEYGPRCPENLIGGGEGGAPEGTVSMTVAVKVPKDCASVEAEADFMREVEIMSAFRHENIVSLVGIVATEAGGTPWMVFEYMPYGDLAEVLRSCNKQFYSSDSPVKSLSKEDLLSISVQIASGMEYLSSQHFVHRDLACRNCLVGENLCVKISDFGMSRDVYTCDYYKVGGSRMLPVRWMAPESIMYGKFTLESDVWSFGVVLWEIYSFGKQPYYGNSNEHVLNLILQGILLSPVDTCPAQVCDVMRKCWSSEPHDRPKFPEILKQLKNIMHSQKGGTPPLSESPLCSAITYSELCMRDETGLQLDADQYLMPKKPEEFREYLTVLSEV